MSAAAKNRSNLYRGTSGDGTRFEFIIVSNDGGTRHVDCSILSIKDAARLAGIEDTCFFRETPREIRAELAQMFRRMSDVDAFLFANTVVDQEQSRELDALESMRVPAHIRAYVLDVIENKMLPWSAMELYIQERHPRVVNLAQWNFGKDHQFHLAGLAVDMDPSLPTIHIGHWGFTQHFETLIPVKYDLVQTDLAGRITARVYRFEGIEFAAAYMPDTCMTVIHAKGEKHCALLGTQNELHVLLQNHRLMYTESAYHFHLRPDTRYYDEGETNPMLSTIEHAAATHWLSKLHMDADVYGQ